MTPSDIGQVAGYIAAALGGGGLVKLYATKRSADSADSNVVINTLVRLLNTEKDEHRTTRDRLSASQTESDMRGAQVGDLGARVEMLEARDKEREERMAQLDERNEECEKRYAELTRRVYRIERKTTPPGDTPGVGIGRPLYHEEIAHE